MFFSRSGADTDAGSRDQVPLLLADTEACQQGGGEEGSVQGPGHPAGQADPQHRHHDGHLRADSLYAQKAATKAMMSF